VKYDTEFAMNEFRIHGQEWLLKRLSSELDLKVVFDVGSNIGEWSRMVRQIYPNGEIHSFEMVPEAYSKLLSNEFTHTNFYPNLFALGDKTGVIPYMYKPNWSVLSSTLTNLDTENGEGSNEKRNAICLRGDDYVISRNIDHIDFLKIDTEGAEGRVMKGFENTFRQGKVRIIEFEYSFGNILDNWLLKDSYEFLEPYGFKIGKLLQDHIEFSDYGLIMEDFKGPDMIAVHEEWWPTFGL